MFGIIDKASWPGVNPYGPLFPTRSEGIAGDPDSGYCDDYDEEEQDYYEFMEARARFRGEDC